MLSIEEFRGLQIGDHVETVPLFPALDKEPIVLRASQKTSTGGRMEFVATYNGITLGLWVCQEKEGVLSWSH